MLTVALGVFRTASTKKCTGGRRSRAPKANASSKKTPNAKHMELRLRNTPGRCSARGIVKRPATPTQVAVIAVISTLIVVALGVGGYALGRSSRTPESDISSINSGARAAAYSTAYRKAFQASRKQGYAHGLIAGEGNGHANGSRAGTLHGEGEARHRVAQQAAQRQRESTGCPAGLVPEGTEACVEPGGQSAGCGGDPYSTPTRSGGCIGPAHPPTPPATPESCPPGQVPVGETGACAPGGSEGASEPKT